MTFTPTRAPNGEPTTCYCCGRQAAPVGIGDMRSEPKYLCQECQMIVADIARIRRFTPYELTALVDAGNEAGALLDRYGKTDLAELDEDQWRSFCKAMITGFGDSLRKQIAGNEGPF